MTLRVLMTTDAIGGVWTYTLDLASALASLDVETVIATIGPAPTSAQRAAAASIVGATLIQTDLPLDWMCDGPGPVLAAGAAIARLAEDFGADVLHLNSPVLAAVAPPAMPVIAINHGCVSSWWQAAKPTLPIDPSLRWHRKLTAEGMRAADRVIAPSASYARLLASHYGLERKPIVVHNGRAPSPGTTSSQADRTALMVGRLWDAVKGAPILDRVAHRIDVPFYAAGALRGPHGETVSLEHLRLIGTISPIELSERLAARPVFVSAATYEPFGLAVLEAAAAGCALVLSDIPTFRELWNDAALFVNPTDEDGFVRAIESLMADDVDRDRRGGLARRHAARFTPETTAGAMLAIYRDAIDACAPLLRATA